MMCLILVMRSVLYTAGALPDRSVLCGLTRAPLPPPSEHATATAASAEASAIAVRGAVFIWAVRRAPAAGSGRHEIVTFSRRPRAIGRSDLLDAQRVAPMGVPAVHLDVERAGLPCDESRVLVGAGAGRRGRDGGARPVPAEAAGGELEDVLGPRVPDPQIEVGSARAVERHRVLVLLDQALLVHVVVVGRP